MKEKIALFFKGMILGAAMIMPGLSGGTLAISMGLYERIVKTVSHFFSDFKNNFKFALNLGLGAVVSVVLLVLILKSVFEKFPIPATLFFIGLILGSIPMLVEKTKIKKTISFSNLFLFFIGILFVFAISLLGDSGKNVILGDFTLLQTLKLVAVGFVAAATVVFPGISGSIVLMAMGYYQPLLNVISETIKFTNLGSNLIILIPFGIGIVIGVLTLVKIIEFLLNKFEFKTYYAITGFLIASVFKVFESLFGYTTNFIQIVIGTILLIIGILLSAKVLKSN